MFWIFAAVILVIFETIYNAGGTSTNNFHWNKQKPFLLSFMQCQWGDGQAAFIEVVGI